MTAPPLTEGRDTDAPTTIFVCVTCRRRADTPLGYDLPGEGLVQALAQEIEFRNISGIAVAPVACLAVCNRPCTVAFAATGKWTHIVGGLDPEAHVADIVATAEKVAAAPDGIVAWAERPQAIRAGGIARVPPVGPGPGRDGNR